LPFAFGQPMAATQIRIGQTQQGGLLVPPELLPPLTSDQVTKVLQVAESKATNEHAQTMQELALRGKAEGGVRTIAVVGLVLVGAFVVVCVFKDRFDIALQVLIPLVTGVAGFLAGEGHERKKKKS
jgi:hypothetical protein